MVNAGHENPADTKRSVVDAVVVGTGFSGIYMLHKLRQLGFSVRAIEAGSDVGGTWYWNRYPGARCDSDSTVYCFSDRFDPEMLAEWTWSERYPSQPELLRYFQWAVDRQDLRRDITFNTRVVSARYNDETNRWTVATDSGETISAQYFIPAVGPLTKPNMPDIAGLDTFAGQWFHTARMPEEPLNYAGKRVAVIGNGATAVQIIPVLAREAAHVYSFTRNPYHCLPGRNHELDPDDWQEIRTHHPEIWAQARENFGGSPYAPVKGMADDFTDTEIEAFFEEAWAKGGLPLAFSTFADTVTSAATNKRFVDFLGKKIAGLVRDPQLAHALTPSTPFVSKRPPIEHGYYSAFNRGNVELIDIKATPIEEITSTGIRVAGGHEYEADIILFATGFDAYTGAMLEMDIRGRSGRPLRDKWIDGPTNYLGLAVEGFPNMFMLYCGPYNPAILTNGPTLIEQQTEWIGNCLEYLRNNGIESIEATQAAEEGFVQMHTEIADATLIPSTPSWWTGTNIKGKRNALLSWCGGFPEYRRVCNEAAESYAGFELAGAASS